MTSGHLVTAQESMCLADVYHITINPMVQLAVQTASCVVRHAEQFVP